MRTEIQKRFVFISLLWICCFSFQIKVFAANSHKVLVVPFGESLTQSRDFQLVLKEIKRTKKKRLIFFRKALRSIQKKRKRQLLLKKQVEKDVKLLFKQAQRLFFHHQFKASLNKLASIRQRLDSILPFLVLPEWEAKQAFLKGRVYLVQQKKEKAKKCFQEVLTYTPKLRLSSSLYPPALIQLFEESRSEANQFSVKFLIQSQPDEAKVFLNGREIGKTKIRVASLVNGMYVLRFEKKGYLSWHKKIMLQKGQDEQITAYLKSERLPILSLKDFSSPTFKSFLAGWHSSYSRILVIGTLNNKTPTWGAWLFEKGRPTRWSGFSLSSVKEEKRKEAFRLALNYIFTGKKEYSKQLEKMQGKKRVRTTSPLQKSPPLSQKSLWLNRVLAWSLLGSGIVVTGGGIALLKWAETEKENAFNLRNTAKQTEIHDLSANRDTKQKLAVTSFLVGGTVAIGGLVLLLYQSFHHSPNPSNKKKVATFPPSVEFSF